MAGCKLERYWSFFPAVSEPFLIARAAAGAEDQGEEGRGGGEGGRGGDPARRELRDAGDRGTLLRRRRHGALLFSSRSRPATVSFYRTPRTPAARFSRPGECRGNAEGGTGRRSPRQPAWPPWRRPQRRRPSPRPRPRRSPPPSQRRDGLARRPPNSVWLYMRP
jgi:hypothetical protein